jgi:hypothetical protein
VKEFKRRIGIKMKDKRKDIRYCNHHPLEVVRLPFTWIKADGTNKNDSDMFKIPIEKNRYQVIIRRTYHLTTTKNKSKWKE